MPTIDLNETTLRTKCLPPSSTTKNGKAKPYEFYWDQKTDGLGVRVKPDGKKDYVHQRKLPGTSKSVRSVIGPCGTITLTQARSKATTMNGKVSEGIDPVALARQTARATLPKTWELFTLREAIAAHVVAMTAKDDSPSSIQQLRHEIESNLAAWLETPLACITNAMCIDRHGELSKKDGNRGGPVLANRVMRMFRACWNSARKRHPELPLSPTWGVTFNKQSRKQSPIPWEQLPAFVNAVEGIDSDIRRDLQYTLLLTGSRVTAVCELRWKDIDFDAGTIHFSKVKGGEDKAYTVPASAWLLAKLAKRKLGNSMTRMKPKSEEGNETFPVGPDDPVFPTYVLHGPRKGQVVRVSEPKEQRFTKVEGTDKVVKRYFHTFTNKKGTHNASPHRLRDTFATACMEAGVGFTETKVLMNHTLSASSVTEGYQRPSIEHLRVCVEKVTAFLLTKSGIGTDGVTLAKSA